jgi:hypothetical protein
MTEKPKRRWFQFSLRTLLLLVLFCGAGLGLLGRKLEQTRRHIRTRRRAVAELNKLGARLRYAREQRVWLARLLGDRLDPVVHVEVRGPAVTDRSLEHLKGLEQLEELGLDGIPATPEAARNLRETLPECPIKHSQHIEPPEL